MRLQTLAFIASIVFGATLVLYNGSKVEGKLVSETDAAFVMAISDTVSTEVPKYRVRWVVYDDGTTKELASKLTSEQVYAEMSFTQVIVVTLLIILLATALGGEI